MTKGNITTIAFVAHEFGLYLGHVGIAVYLYNICKYLIKAHNPRVIFDNLKNIKPDYVEVAVYQSPISKQQVIFNIIQSTYASLSRPWEEPIKAYISMCQEFGISATIEDFVAEEIERKNTIEEIINYPNNKYNEILFSSNPTVQNFNFNKYKRIILSFFPYFLVQSTIKKLKQNRIRMLKKCYDI